ncbi:hypothetical protein EC950083_2655, partial [Escherichia coli 95.0083]
MRVEICIAKEKITKMPNGAVDALTWNKRYITLAPIATVLGLAFKLS